MIFLMLDDLVKITDTLMTMAHEHKVPSSEYGRLIVQIMDPADGQIHANIIDLQEEKSTKEGNIYACAKS